jgi:hypothetical protein
MDIGPESCAVAREGHGEALTGVRIGQPLSRESFLFWVQATHSGAIARAPGRPAWSETWHVQTPLAREPGDLAIDRSATAIGSHREGEEP